MRLLAAIKKDGLLLLRDRVGLALLFAMPVVLVLLVTSIQKNAFAASGNGVGVLTLVQNRDTGRFSRDVLSMMGGAGQFHLEEMDGSFDVQALQGAMGTRQAMLTILFPADFSARVGVQTRGAANRSLQAFGLEEDTLAIGAPATGGDGAIGLLYNSSLDARERQFSQQVVGGILRGVESRETLRLVYGAINGKPLPDSLANTLTGEGIPIRELSVAGRAEVPLNATQYNVPAWTIFAMFFVVMSLGGSIVKEKTGGSAIRLRTMPTNFLVALLSKELVYLAVTFLQALVIFGLGVWVFPWIGLPALRLPADGIGLIVVTLLCGWCAVSYALLVGVFARTQEQSNGFGAISVVILAMLGGLMVPPFIMPEGLRHIMRFSPLHWAVECYQGLFLEGGTLAHIGGNVVPLAAIALVMQVIAIGVIKRNRYI